MATPRITRSALRSLHSSYVQTAQSFQSYNFREYFVRLSDRKFGKELEQLGLASQVGQSGSTTSSSSSSAPSSASASSSTTSPTSTSTSESEDLLSSLSAEQQERIQSWWNRANSELAQLQRASVVNNLFIAPKLVVEGRGNVMVSGGGGAGMEAGLVLTSGSMCSS